MNNKKKHIPSIYIKYDYIIDVIKLLSIIFKVIIYRLIPPYPMK